MQAFRLCPSGKEQLLCQWTCTTLPAILCYSDWHIKCFPFSYSFISFFIPYSSHIASMPEIVSLAAESGPLAISSSWCGYHYWCYVPSLGLFIFRVQGLSYPVEAPGLVLCTMCMLPCKNCRLLHSYCIKWSFDYLLRWFPYIWTVVLPKLIHVIKVVQYLFQTSLPYFEFVKQAWYYSYSNIHTYPSECGCWLYL